jgi:cell division protein FtsN
MNSNDLISVKDGNKMTFVPDYPGDYSIEVIISEYGDEISNQIFNFSILDFSEKNNEENLKDTLDNESWLDEELDDDIDELTSAQEEFDKDADELTSAQEEFDEEVDLISKDTNLSKTKLRKSNISERTDRFTIQITSKKMLKDAQLFSNELIKRGYDAYIQKVLFKSNETFYRVRVGSYDNYNSAKIAAKSLSKDLKMTTWVDFVRKEQ